MSARTGTSWTENADEIERLRAENEALRDIVRRTAQYFSGTDAPLGIAADAALTVEPRK